MSRFSDYLRLVREIPRTLDDKIINDATRSTYILNRMLKNRPDQRALTDGSAITEQTQLDDAATFSFYSPGSDRSPSRTSVLATIRVPWRYGQAHQVMLEVETAQTSGRDRTAMFKSMKRASDQILATDISNGMERSLWTVPNAALMENLNLPNDTTPGLPFSIPTYITETPQRCPGWTTTIGSVDPVARPGWDNQRQSYDPADIGDPTSGLFAAFDAVSIRVNWEVVPNYQQFSESDDLKRLMILTTESGLMLYTTQLRAANDHTRAGSQDPSYGSPTWMGKPIVRAQAMEQALLEQSSASVYAGTPYAADRPRFYFVNGQYLFPVFHKDKFDYEREPVHGGPSAPDVLVRYVERQFNIMCLSRRRQGIVFPQYAS